jgi:hypothetical protein
MPHLTCCCASMKKGLKADYDDPDAGLAVKKAAYVFLDHGTLVTEVQPSGAVNFQLQVTPPSGTLVITGDTKGKKVQKITVTLASGSNDIIFFNQPDDTAHDSHWHAYYDMGNDKAGCLGTPKNDPVTCGPKTTGCMLTPAKKKIRVPAKAVKAVRNDLFTVVDLNCSGSQWP